MTEQDAAVLAMMLAAIDYYTARIEQLTAKIEVLCEPYLPQIAQLDAVPGTGLITAQDVLAEIGTGMTVFPAAAHLVSWAKWCPQVAQSGGKRKGANSSGRGNRYPGAALGEAAPMSSQINWMTVSRRMATSDMSCRTSLARHAAANPNY